MRTWTIDVGSIPAWAGEPHIATIIQPRKRVYPRVGGGTRQIQYRKAKVSGLSPRGRGNRSPTRMTGPRIRSIPAWAGEPQAERWAGRHCWVYPRVGGGTHSKRRRWGRTWGLSPRGRGNREGGPAVFHNDRSIPAWAGEPIRLQACKRLPWVYPRVGGGTDVSNLPIKPWMGLSPRGRGNLRVALRRGVDGRSIPAWAGEPTPQTAPTKSRRVYPRVGGGTPCPSQLNQSPGGLSPRGRGNHLHGAAHSVSQRSIPAWAGEPNGLVLINRWRWVYPRVGGGTRKGGVVLLPCRGLSPRGRGNRGSGCWFIACLRSIPAWAGEPPCDSGYNPVATVYPRVGGGTCITLTRSLTAHGLSPRGRGNRLEP